MERSEGAGQVGQDKIAEGVVRLLKDFNSVLWGTLMNLSREIVLVIEVCLLGLEFWVCHFLAL